MVCMTALNSRLQIEIWFYDFQRLVCGNPEVTMEKIKQTLKNRSRSFREQII